MLGEDPGLLNAESDNGSMILSLLWLLVGVGWAAWRLKVRRGEWYVGVVEAALGVAVVLFFITAETAAHKYPARIIAWEWLILLVGFVVVRHLAATPEVRHGLFSVFLATGLMASAHGVFQALVDIPAMQSKAEKGELREIAEKHGYQFDDARFEMIRRRIQEGHAYGTFAHPNSFAGYLALLLPGLIGAAVVCLRNRADARLTRLASTAALVGIAALWVTHSRGDFPGRGGGRSRRRGHFLAATAVGTQGVDVRRGGRDCARGSGAVQVRLARQRLREEHWRAGGSARILAGDGEDDRRSSLAGRRRRQLRRLLSALHGRDGRREDQGPA